MDFNALFSRYPEDDAPITNPIQALLMGGGGMAPGGGIGGGLPQNQGRIAGPGGLAGPVSGGQQLTPVPWATAPRTPDNSGHSLLDHPGQMENGVLSGDGVTVTGDGWKPDKRSTLGTVLDMLFGKPIFANRIRNKNIQGAMEDFDPRDPMKNVKRLMQVPGMQKDAWALYDRVSDNRRQDAAADSLQDSRKDRYMDRMASWANRIQNSANPAETYQQMRPVMQRYAEMYGIDDMVELPETYDPGSVDSLVTGKVLDEELKRRALAQHRASRLDLDERKFEDQSNYKQERLEDFDQAEAGRNSRFQQGEAGKDRRQSAKPINLKQKYGGRVVRDSSGALVEWNGDGTKMKVTSKDGSKTAFFKMSPDGKPVRVGE
jgi:hypothetical protein